MSELTDKLDAPLPSVKITCTSVACGEDLHCFLQKRRTGNLAPYGPCRACGAERVNWERAHRRDPADVDLLFKELRTEVIREHMWTKPFDEDAIRRAEKLDRKILMEKARRRLASSVGKPANAYDGLQTKMGENVVFYAQHATATCCRKCMNYWHGIDKNTHLTSEELDYCMSLVERYLDQRLPEIEKASE